MTQRWVGSDDVDAPQAVECAEVGYPHPDEHGHTQHDNTHHDTEALAWEAIRGSAKAGVMLSGRLVEQRRASLREAEAVAGEDAERFHRVERGFRRWERAISRGDE